MALENTNNKNETLKDAINGLYKTREPVETSEFYKKGETSNIKILGNHENKQRLHNVVSILSKSPHGQLLLNKASERDYCIEFADGLDSLGVCNPDTKMVHINTAMSDHEAVAVLAHELRHAHQFASGMNLFAEVDSTKTQIQITRAMEADAESNAGLVTWQLKESGIAEPWEHFKKDGPEVAKEIEKIAPSSECNTYNDVSKLLMAGFKGWYNDYDVREMYDKQHVELLQKIRENDIVEKIAFDRSCPISVIVDKVCKLGDRNYFNDNGESPEMLDQKEFLGISKNTMIIVDGFFNDRKKEHGLSYDHSITEIPVYEFREEKGRGGRRRGNTKSIYWAPVMNASLRKEKAKLAIEANRRNYIKDSKNVDNASNQNNSNSTSFSAAKLKSEKSRI